MNLLRFNRVFSALNGVLFGLGILLAGCSGGGGGGNATPSGGGGATNVAPSFTGQPSGATVTLGAVATFTAVAGGTPAPTFQWERSPDGNVWNPISGATSAAFSFIPAKPDHATQFRAKATNSQGVATSNAVVLAVQWAPSISTQPVGPSVQAPTPASFSVTADANPPATFQWQSSLDGALWTDLAGATVATFTTGATSSVMNGLRFRCIAANSVGSATSQPATLLVNVPSFTLTVQLDAGATGTPAATRTVAVGSSVDYNYSPSPGFTNLIVLLDGVAVPPAGSVLMNASHALAISTTQIQRSVTFTAGSGGTISGATAQTIRNGGSATPVTALPAGGFGFVNWTGSGFPGSTANPITLSNVTQDLALTANFSAAPIFALNVNLGTGVSGAPMATAALVQGTVVDYIYSLQAGFMNLAVQLDDTPVSASGSFTMNAAHSLAATAQPIPPNTIQVGMGGLMFVPNTLTVHVGTQITFHWAGTGHSVVIGSPCTPAGGGQLNTGVQSAGFEATITPTSAGDVPFFCQPHCGFGMTGVIHVLP